MIGTQLVAKGHNFPHLSLAGVIDSSGAISPADRFDRMALDRALANLIRAQRDLTADVLGFEAPRITFYLWSPWRCTALEHRVFDSLKALPRVAVEEDPDEWRLHVADPKVARSALQTVERVLKGWQEEGDPASERSAWRWLLEADTDDHGYDHAGELAGLWAFLRLSVDRGNVEEGDKAEDIDLNGFGLRIWGTPS